MVREVRLLQVIKMRIALDALATRFFDKPPTSDFTAALGEFETHDVFDLPAHRRPARSVPPAHQIMQVRSLGGCAMKLPSAAGANIDRHFDQKTLRFMVEFIRRKLCRVAVGARERGIGYLIPFITLCKPALVIGHPRPVRVIREQINGHTRILSDMTHAPHILRSRSTIAPRGSGGFRPKHPRIPLEVFREVVRNLKLHSTFRLERIYGRHQPTDSERLGLEIPRRRVARVNALLLKVDHKQALPTKYAQLVEIARDREKPGVVRPDEARVAAFDVQAVGDAQDAARRVAHRDFAGGVDLRDEAAVG